MNIFIEKLSFNDLLEKRFKYLSTFSNAMRCIENLKYLKALRDILEGLNFLIN